MEATGAYESDAFQRMHTESAPATATLLSELRENEKDWPLPPSCTEATLTPVAGVLHEEPADDTNRDAASIAIGTKPSPLTETTPEEPSTRAGGLTLFTVETFTEATATENGDTRPQRTQSL